MGERDEPRRGGMPGDGAGRRDEVGETGVHPFGAEDAPDDAAMRQAGSWGRSPYEESGRSELGGPDPGGSSPEDADSRPSLEGGRGGRPTEAGVTEDGGLEEQ